MLHRTNGAWPTSLLSILRPRPGGSSTPSGANTRSTRCAVGELLEIDGEADVVAVLRRHALHHRAHLVLGAGRRRLAHDLPVAVLGLDRAALRRLRLRRRDGQQQQRSTSTKAGDAPGSRATGGPASYGAKETAKLNSWRDGGCGPCHTNRTWRSSARIELTAQGAQRMRDLGDDSGQNGTPASDARRIGVVGAAPDAAITACA